ncbi:Sodium:dicarboxylate symporter [Citrobacter freundii]|uniref:Sodium:dicarboxylate symporter n=1 Tax=Citrobacter freundii TaxID=546 RepID=A0A7G2IX15_CITFR|nr:Sodium:dicarboxylate symporter [Citrobacter freundii]
MANANKLTLFIVIFMLAGILSGAVIHSYASPRRCDRLGR